MRRPSLGKLKQPDSFLHSLQQIGFTCLLRISPILSTGGSAGNKMVQAPVLITLSFCWGSNINMDNSTGWNVLEENKAGHRLQGNSHIGGLS